MAAKVVNEGIFAAKFPVWKTVKFGIHKSLIALRDALERGEVVVTVGGSVILAASEFLLSAEEKEFDLVLASPSDLGLAAEEGTKTVDHWDVLKRAHEIGLRVCPAAIGPELALICGKRDMPQHGVVVGMPLMADGCNPEAFYLYYEDEDGGLVLDGSDDNPDFRWDMNLKGVFIKPRR